MCYVVCSVFFVCTVGLCVYNLLITYDELVNINPNYKRCKGWFVCWTVSEHSLQYDDTRHVRTIQNFWIGTSLSNWIRIGTSDSNWIRIGTSDSNRISKLHRSLVYTDPNLLWLLEWRGILQLANLSSGKNAMLFKFLFIQPTSCCFRLHHLLAQTAYLLFIMSKLSSISTEPVHVIQMLRLFTLSLPITYISFIIFTVIFPCKFELVVCLLNFPNNEFWCKILQAGCPS